jgi:hypothetical protein
MTPHEITRMAIFEHIADCITSMPTLWLVPTEPRPTLVAINWCSDAVMARLGVPFEEML